MADAHFFPQRLQRCFTFEKENLVIVQRPAQIFPLGVTQCPPPPREDTVEKVELDTQREHVSHVLTKGTSEETYPMLAGNTELWRKHWK